MFPAMSGSSPETLVLADARKDLFRLLLYGVNKLESKNMFLDSGIVIRTIADYLTSVWHFIKPHDCRWCIGNGFGDSRDQCQSLAVENVWDGVANPVPHGRDLEK
jgi:hypothetical protein